jgi:hypothetical protein
MGTRNRATVRKAIATSLSSSLTGAGNPAQELHNHFIGDFGGKSPVVVVASTGLATEALSLQGSRITYFFDVMVFVLRGEATGDYTEADADDQMDAVADDIETWIASNRSATNWDALNLREDSTVTPVVVGGDPYWMERYPLEVLVL